MYKTRLKLLASLFLFWITSCGGIKESHEEYFVKTLLKSIEVNESYVFCDSNRIDNCYLDYLGKHYLKKEKAFFNDKGSIDSIQVLSQKA